MRGNDSSVLLDLMARLGLADLAIHVDTTIGIPATRDFVRQRCKDLDVLLHIERPPIPYADLVEAHGFPGPAHHFKMYQRLKERSLRQARKKLVRHPRQERVLFIAGRRRAESTRRQNVPEHERIDATIWASPLAHWTKAHLEEYRERHAVPRNPVAEKLGMSGECLCGSFAEPGELALIRQHYPDVAAELDSIGERAHAAGHPEERCHYGWGAYRASRPSKTGPMCSSCDFRADPAIRARALAMVTA
jgi:3'-phosphoadenosine 5'-phosphosulfate sulfotransferase (PAPS reductase)/FAD synthetase